MKILISCLIGVVLDWLWGDPVWMYHPVRVIGKAVALLEKVLFRAAGKEPSRQLAAGCLLWGAVAVLSLAVPLGILGFVEKMLPQAAFILECFWCYQLLAARCLAAESRKVYRELKEGNLSGARKAVSMIVGRDTERLSEEGVAKAAVETVAENTSDGVIAPLFYLMIGGPALGFLYKAINTMDSMVGYKNETYLYFGRAAAKMDDAANYIPARISAGLMIASAWILGMDGKGAYRILRRDGRKHASPNAAQTEAACAGALGVQLAGDAWYFGKRCRKEFIGDPIRGICPEDILRANRLMFGTEVLAVILFGSVRLFLR